MEENKCPVCSSGALKEVWGDFATEFATRDGGVRPLLVQNLSWLQCEECGESILDELASGTVEAARRQAQGLLGAGDIKELRSRLRLKQAEMSRLLGIGEKTYCRWETGAYIQSLAFDRYLRLLIAEPRNVHLLMQMEDGLNSRSAQPAELAPSFKADRLIFGNLQFRPSLVEMSQVFTDLLTAGRLHVLPGNLAEVQ
jgi:putative zinc finger/helix-turn-helix YgiT family protein